MGAERTFVTVFCRVCRGADDRVEGGAEEGGYCRFHRCGSRVSWQGIGMRGMEAEMEARLDAGMSGLFIPRFT
jgi:hypothetical protein